MNEFAKKQDGFMLIEIIIGVSILALCLFGVISVGQYFLRLSFQSFQEVQASFLLEEGNEVARAFRDVDWANISSLTPGTKYYLNYSGGAWTTSTSASQIDHVFYRYITVSSVNRDPVTADIVTSGGVLDPNMRKITATVEWETSMGSSKKVMMQYLTDL